jgi:hypothetical protein
MIPTRLRAAVLQETIDSYLSRADNTDRIEVIVRVHDDDPETLEWVKTRDKKIRVIIGDTEDSYGSTFKFINCMAAVSNGDWLWPGADDHRLLSQDWDKVLAGWLPEPRKTCLLLTAKVVNWPNGRIPIMSRGLYRVLGHYGLTGFADTYLDSLTHFAGLQVSSGLEVQDKNIAPMVPKEVMKWWTQYKGDENAHCFNVDKIKLGAVLGRDLGNWTTSNAPELP